MVVAPFYQDWTFWTMVVAALELILSQFPPLLTLLKGNRLELEAFNIIDLTHSLGNPNARLYVAINNLGGRNVKIKSIKLTFSRGKEIFSLPAQAYYPTLSDQKAVILPPFSLKPGETWEHITQFYESFSREDEKLSRQLIANNRADILKKREALPIDSKVNVEADQKNVLPLIDFFNKLFKWNLGEYETVLSVETESAKTNISKKYRITLFESDSTQLKSYTDDYKIGMGVCWQDYDKHSTIPLPFIAV